LNTMVSSGCEPMRVISVLNFCDRVWLRISLHRACPSGEGALVTTIHHNTFNSI